MRAGRAPRGFSLIETLVSSALFFVGLVAVLSTFNTAARLLAHHRNVSRAVAIAEATIEDLVQRHNSDPAIQVDVAPAPRWFDREGDLSATPSVYEATWSVAPFAPLEGIREVTVTVSWTEWGGQARSLQLRTWRS